MSDLRSINVQIARKDDEKRVVYGEVYAPNTLDSHGEMMFDWDIETMAHRFLKEVDLPNSIDTNHNNQPNGSYPVESFIARRGDPDFTEGAWVLGVKVPDEQVWSRVKSGDLNAFSFEALVRPVDVEVEVEVIRDHVGKTEGAEDHTHVYFVQLDEMGRVVRGWTDEVNGHSHRIATGCKTLTADGHSHRVFL